jgi:two-component system phosphate regulon sensor histidine kinase PhoR
MDSTLATLRREAEALSKGRHVVTVEDLAGIDLLGSPRELHSAFSNLVSNAVRYTPEGGTIAITFERDEEGGAMLPSTACPRAAPATWAAPAWAWRSSSTCCSCTRGGWR